jgi:hypothetical protein
MVFGRDMLLLLVICMHHKGFFIVKIDKARAYVLFDTSLRRYVYVWHCPTLAMFCKHN